MPNKGKNLKTKLDSEKELPIILSLLDMNTDEEIAMKMQRKPSFIKRIRADRARLDNIGNIKYIIEALHKKQFWGEIQKQLTTSEVAFFENMWAELIGQFS